MDSKTLDYYNSHAKAYFDRSHHSDLSQSYKLFLKHFQGTSLLDVGSGTGRDAAYFFNEGFQMTCLDGSRALLDMAQEACPSATFHRVDVRESFSLNKTFDGIWSAATLLHLDLNEFRICLQSLKNHLKTKGIIFLGLKKIDYYPRDSRFFRYWNYNEIALELKNLGLETIDQLTYTNESAQWINVIARHERKTETA